MPSVLVHDLRLQGDTPQGMSDVPPIEVDDQYPISALVSEIINRTSSSISRLLIMCHGYESSSTGSASIPASEGFGLQLCMEDLTLANTGALAPLYDCVEDIILYACGPANTHPFAKNTEGDGKRFCSELAAYTNANVYASDATQSYHNLKYDPGKLVCETIPIDFGEWEGHVYRFSPDGSVVTVQ